MSLYVWVKPAFVKGSPVDHTWVTTYDSRVTMYNSPQDVQANGEHYWFCKGLFHRLGVSNRYPGGEILKVPHLLGSDCLVQFDNPKAGGTVVIYGVHGVCHQVSNQVLFPTGKTVKAARGYRLSSAIFGTYGRWSNDKWLQKRIQCGVAPVLLRPGHRPMSLLYSRARYYFGDDSMVPLTLETLVKGLHNDIDTIGFSARGPNEIVTERVASLNRRISSFVMKVADAVADEVGGNGIVQRLLGVSPGEEINLIDPELFEFPDPQDRPIR